MPKYRIADLVMQGRVGLSPNVEHQRLHPFTPESAMAFLANFSSLEFEANTSVESVFIYAGKNAPSTYYMVAWLFAHTLDELAALEAKGTQPKPNGEISLRLA